jgi:hypothetical protein
VQSGRSLPKFHSLTMEAANISETSVNFHQATRRNNSDDSKLHARRREGLRGQPRTNTCFRQNMTLDTCEWRHWRQLCVRAEYLIRYFCMTLAGTGKWAQNLLKLPYIRFLENTSSGSPMASYVQRDTAKGTGAIFNLFCESTWNTK